MGGVRMRLAPWWPPAPFDARWHSEQRGLWGEHAVARHLWRKGWRVLEHRWKAVDGSDIDLVLADEQRLLFAEVKVRTRFGEGDDPWAEVFDPERQKNLLFAAGDYLRATRQPFAALRFDAYLVKPLPSRRRDPEILVETDYLDPAAVPGWRGLP